MLTFVINLDTKIENFEKQLPHLRRIGLEPKRFSAVTPDTISKYVHKQTAWCKNACPMSAVCISTSHALVAKMIYESGVDYGLVMEDDAFPLDTSADEFFLKVQKTLSEVPKNWDIILLHCDGWCPHDDNKISKKSWSFAAYLLSRKGAEKLSNFPINGNFDFETSVSSNFLKYKSKENLFYTDEKTSTNRKKIFTGMDSIFNSLFPPNSGEKTWTELLGYKVVRIPFTNIELTAEQIHIVVFLVIILILYYILVKFPIRIVR